MTNTAKALWILGALQMMLTAFKVIGVINWSWLWVLSPTWIPWAICGLLFVVFLMIAEGKR